MRFLFLALSVNFCLISFAQKTITPDELYGDLFKEIQMARVFPDGKTFVDMVPRRSPASIMTDHRRIKKSPPANFSLKEFVEANFEMPASHQTKFSTSEKDISAHIKALWPLLKRQPDKQQEGSSLLALPYPYIVPGGRSREVYYWDSYFTMLGLRESGETKVMEEMVDNFAFLIRTYGHIPNGNRTYYLSRSQPPFFSLMVEMLSDMKGDAVLPTYLPMLEKEYAYWMDGSDKLANGSAANRVVRMLDGSLLNRYWDDSDAPRQESYREDVATADEAVRSMLSMKEFRNEKERAQAADEYRRWVYRQLRAAAASGWDFSSRWLGDDGKLTGIRTTNFIPIDLNCLLYLLECTLRNAYLKSPAAKPDERARLQSMAGQYQKRAEERRKAIEKFCWNEEKGIYADHDLTRMMVSDKLHMAGMYALFSRIADRARAERHKDATVRELLKGGGFQTTASLSGQQWDAPNGWAPLQWIAILGLESYDYYEEARMAAERWVALNRKVFQVTGRLTEKYNVVDLKLEGGGGEYPDQDGFGWTNGVLLALINKFNL